MGYVSDVCSIELLMMVRLIFLILAQVPLLALTATATPRVQEDIVSNLELRSPLITTTSFDRYMYTYMCPCMVRRGKAQVWNARIIHNCVSETVCKEKFVYRFLYQLSLLEGRLVQQRTLCITFGCSLLRGEYENMIATTLLYAK